MDKYECHVGNVTLPNPLICGAGTCKTFEETSRALRSAVGGTEIGTFTPSFKPGHEGQTFYAQFSTEGVLLWTLNSLGLPNQGKDAVTKWAPDAVGLARKLGKRIGINVTGDTIEKIIEMVVWALQFDFDWVTINAGCPNKWVDGVPQAILSFDLKDTDLLIQKLDREIGNSGTEIWWKPSPFTDTLGLLRESVEIIAKSRSITGYIANNTVPHCYAWDRSDEKRSGKPAIDPGNGLAGLAGPAVKPMTEGHVRMIRGLLPEQKSIIASGGVTYGEDIQDMLKSGASATMATSVLWANDMDYREYGRMLSEYGDLVE